MAKEKPRRRHRPRSFWEKFWENEHGEPVIWQSPNAFLITWAVATVLNIFLSLGRLETIVGYVGLVALIVWALLELFRGVNNFRKLLGLLVLLALIASRFGI